MFGRNFGAACAVCQSVVLGGFLGGCSGPVGLYHEAEGGAIAQTRQAPPGENLPYPNLADVPNPQEAAPAGQAATIAATARGQIGGVSAPSPEALAGLTLPTAPPPLPDVPGLNIPALPTPAPGLAPPPPAPVPPPAPLPPPSSFGFARGSALLPSSEQGRLQALAAQSAGRKFVVGGFGDGSLNLAIYRARRLADGLTAAGVPASAIRLTALAAGSGGFVQLVY